MTTHSLSPSLFHFTMNFDIKCWSFNLITWRWERRGEWLNFPSRKAGNVIFPGSADSLYDEKVLAGCERNSVSFQGIHICLPSRSFYKRAKRTRGACVRSWRGSLRRLQNILSCFSIRSMIIGLKLRASSVF